MSLKHAAFLEKEASSLESEPIVIAKVIAKAILSLIQTRYVTGGGVRDALSQNILPDQMFDKYS